MLRERRNFPQKMLMAIIAVGIFSFLIFAIPAKKNVSEKTQISETQFAGTPFSTKKFAGTAKDFLAENFYKKTAGTIRIATLNLCNFFEEKRYVDGRFYVNAPKPDSEREALRKIVKMVEPDVLLVQELGNEDFAKQLVEDLKTAGIFFPNFATLKGRDTHRQNAILSKISFEKILEFPLEEKMCRGILGVKISTKNLGNAAAGTPNLTSKNESVEIFVVHLKSRISRSGADPECVRERCGEMRCVRNVLSGKTRWILGGDFNDVPESEAIAVILSGNFSKKLSAKDVFGSAWTFRNKRKAFEFIFDHIFVSPEIFEFYVPGSARIVDPEISEKASDHRLVFADFDFSKKNFVPAKNEKIVPEPEKISVTAE